MAAPPLPPPPPTSGPTPVPALRLRAGVHVVRRDDRHLQVGLDPPARLIVPDLPVVRALLADLAAGCAHLGDETAHRLVRDLRGAGLLADPPAPPPGAVAVLGAEALVAEAVRLLEAAGVPVEDGPRSAVTLVVSDGEPPRALVDEQVRAGRDHLVLAGTATGFRVGPFVRPGETACLRCVDAHRAEHDPRRAVVVEQLAGLPLTAPDPVLRALALAWAVRELRGYLGGRRPDTWSAEVSLDDGPEPRRTPWTRHVHCGCSWADGLAG